MSGATRDSAKNALTPGAILIIIASLVGLIGLNIGLGMLMTVTAAARVARSRANLSDMPNMPGMPLPVPSLGTIEAANQEAMRRQQQGLPDAAGGDAPPPTPPPVVAGGGPVAPSFVPKTTFATVDEAITSARAQSAPERLAALAYLNSGRVVAARRKDAVSVLLLMWNDPTGGDTAFAATMKWADESNAVELRQALQSMIGGDPSRLDPIRAEKALAVGKKLLEWKDKETLPLVFSLLRAKPVHNEVRDLLAAQSDAAEELAAKNATPADNNPLAIDAIGLLGQVGTQKSITVLQTAMADNDPAIAKAGKDALNELGERLKISHDDLWYNLLNRYEVSAPVGFQLDKSVDSPNTRQWTRTAGGRVVKSIYAVQVKQVGKDYKFDALPGGNTIQAGTLMFMQMPAPDPPQFTQSVHYAALDGEVLIEFMAVLDTADSTAANAMNNAVKKIKAK